MLTKKRVPMCVFKDYFVLLLFFLMLLLTRKHVFFLFFYRCCCYREKCPQNMSHFFINVVLVAKICPKNMSRFFLQKHYLQTLFTKRHITCSIQFLSVISHMCKKCQINKTRLHTNLLVFYSNYRIQSDTRNADF